MLTDRCRNLCDDRFDPRWDQPAEAYDDGWTLKRIWAREIAF
jgi:hypothetical protein